MKLAYVTINISHLKTFMCQYIIICIHLNHVSVFIILTAISARFCQKLLNPLPYCSYFRWTPHSITSLCLAASHALLSTCMFLPLKNILNKRRFKSHE